MAVIICQLFQCLDVSVADCIRLCCSMQGVLMFEVEHGCVEEARASRNFTLKAPVRVNLMGYINTAYFEVRSCVT